MVAAGAIDQHWEARFEQSGQAPVAYVLPMQVVVVIALPLTLCVCGYAVRSPKVTGSLSQYCSRLPPQAAP